MNAKFTRDLLHSYVERVENLESEIKELNSDKSDVYAEAKGNGFDIPALKAVIAYRRKDAAKRQEFEAIFDTYMHALEGGTLVANIESRAHTREEEPTTGPKRRMWNAREEIFRELEEQGLLPSTDTAKSVYFLHAPAAKLIKIGCSDNIEKRLASLAGGSPIPLKLLGTLPGGRALELELHEKFQHLRVRGEWFSDGDHEIRSFISKKPAKPSVEEESARVPSEPSSSPAPQPHDDRRIEAEQNSVVAGSPSVDCSNVVSIARPGYGLPDDEFNEIPKDCLRTESKVLQ